MGWEAWYTLGVMALVFFALLRNWGPSDAILLGAALLVTLAGIITPVEAFGGFTNPGVLTIAGLFVVAAGLRETGALDAVTRITFGNVRSERKALIRMAVPVTALSAFMNNTPVVATLGPLVMEWCRRNNISPSRLLMPLSYLAILGGACTLIGTSTNIVINSLMVEAQSVHPEHAESLRSMHLFELAYIGLPYVVVGVAYIVFVGPRLLPDRKDLLEQLDESPREYMVNMSVEPGCRLIGQNITEAGLRHLPGLFLNEIARSDHVIAPVVPAEVIEEGDILTFSGVVATIVDLERIPGLVPVTDEGYEARAAERRTKMMCEAVVSDASPLVGKTIRAGEFRSTYNAAIIAVHRGGERIGGRIGDIVLRPGDTLLLQAGPDFSKAFRNSRDFYLVSDVSDSQGFRDDRALISLGLLALLIVLMMVIEAKEIVAFTVAALMVATRCIWASTARRSIDWQVLVTIGAAVGFGKALENSGLAAMIGDRVVEVAGNFGPYAVLFSAYVMTSVFTESITNKAAAVLMFPISLSMALSIGADPRPFIMATTVASAATFASPLGFPTNLMVYGPGGYHFTDFVRVGLPLNVTLTLLGTFLIPLIWPF